MKSRMLSLVAAVGLLVSSCGTTYTSTSNNAAYNVQVPMGIRSNFEVRYPDASNIVWNKYDAAAVPVDWELNGWTALDADDYAVTFDMGKNKYYAWYDSNGMLIGSAYAITDYTQLPPAVNTAWQTKYNGYTLESVQRESWGNQTAYELKLMQGENKVKLLVDSNGTIVKEKMK